MLHDTEFELFRDSYRRFLKEQVAPYYEQWEHEGLIPRD
ncbi:acyl-CoA dehydrogenase family protein, partial [Acinetobacter baumannii]